jgi:transcriptional regulator with XRE-family HTH domain
MLAGLTGDEVAADLGWSPSKVSRYELARTGLKPGDVAKLLTRYGVDRARQRELLALADEAMEKGWWEAYSDVLPEEYAALIGLEAEARACSTWSVEVIPGLLQTEEYARQVNSGYRRLVPVPVPPGEMERRVQAQLKRQELLTREPPLELSVVLDESALLRRLADRPVMCHQLERLVEVGQLPNVSLRVFPLARRYPIVMCSFVLFRFAQDRRTTIPDVVYAEHLRSNLYFEGESDTYQYSLAFDLLLQESLGRSESLQLISETARRVWS